MCDYYKGGMLLWGRDLLLDNKRYRMLSSERLVYVVMRTVWLRSYACRMSLTISSVLPVPGIPSTNVQYDYELKTLLNAFSW